MSGDSRVEKHVAHYELGDIRRAFEAGLFEVPRRVGRYLRTAGLNLDDVVECVAQLNSADFRKSQEHISKPGVWLDIYRPRYWGRRMYVKFVAYGDGQRIVLLSFCNDGDPH